MIIITGAAGFIGSCLVAKLNALGHKDLLLVDDFSKTEKISNHQSKDCLARLERSLFPEWLESHSSDVSFVFHLGARTDTTEFDLALLNELNYLYTQKLWTICSKHNIPFLYASSAATYGLGEWGYSDDHDLIPKLKPLNPYGNSKNAFDRWALQQQDQPPFWCGLKFFNVYGPNEYHKGRMASVILHAFRQIQETGAMKLFRSHHPDFKDGEQLRDFIYVKDVVEVLCFMMDKRPAAGIYNLGTGEARSFLALTQSTFLAMGLKASISFVDTPADIRDKYQYYTQAEMGKLRGVGYTKAFCSLEDGVYDYVTEYLQKGEYY